jgi:hypothetical protein
LIINELTEKKWAIENKRSSVPTIGKGFHIAADNIKAMHSNVVYAGQDTFRLGKGLWLYR